MEKLTVTELKAIDVKELKLYVNKTYALDPVMIGWNPVKFWSPDGRNGWIEFPTVDGETLRLTGWYRHPVIDGKIDGSEYHRLDNLNVIKDWVIIGNEISNDFESWLEEERNAHAKEWVSARNKWIDDQDVDHQFNMVRKNYWLVHLDDPWIDVELRELVRQIEDEADGKFDD